MLDKPGSSTDLDWRDIFWREWCHTEDEALAGRLFGALADEAPSPQARQAVRGPAVVVYAAWGLTIGGLCSVGYWVTQLSSGLVPVWVLAVSAALGALVGVSEAALIARARTWREFLSESLGLLVAARANKVRLASLLAAVPAAVFATILRQTVHTGLVVPGAERLWVGVAAAVWLAALATAGAQAYPGMVHERMLKQALRASTEMAVPFWLEYLRVGERALAPGTPSSLIDFTPPLPYRVLQARAFTWWRGRPSREEFIAACRHSDAPEWARGLVKQVRASEIPPPAELVKQLMPEPGKLDPTASERLLWWEGKAMDALAGVAYSSALPSPVATQLARQIAARTRRRFPAGVDGLLCPDCVTRMRAHKARLSPAETVTYYACRCCKQSKKAIQHAGEVVAIVDSEDERPLLRKGESLRVNWLARARKKAFEGQDVFDFDRVVIVRASDEDVRHFLVDVTSDTDPTRRKRYPAMECRIGPECDLSENTLRALRKAFGVVRVS